MKKTETIKNLNFHRQLKSEKIQEVAIILLLSFNNKTVYDIICCKNGEQLQQRIKEININNVIGWSYVAVTDSTNFVEYKKIMISK